MQLHVSPEKWLELIRHGGTARNKHISMTLSNLQNNSEQSRKEDKRQHAPTTLSHDLGARDRWPGVGEQRGKYNPIPYRNKGF